MRVHKLKVRKMDVSDIRFVDQAERDQFGKSLSEKTLSNELLYNDLAYYYMALIDSKRVGYIGVWITIPNAEITTIMVIPEYRHQGLGRELMRCVYQLCQEKNVDDLTLEVRVSNEQAIQFYHLQGFKIVSIRKNYYDDGEDAYLMVKHLGG